MDDAHVTSLSEPGAGAMPSPDQDAVHRAGKDWWLVGASLRGSSHVAGNRSREDCFQLITGPIVPAQGGHSWFAIAVADGVGSVPCAREGSTLAVDRVMAVLQAGLDLPSGAPAGDLTELLRDAAKKALEAIEATAERNQRRRSHYATTLLVAVGVQSRPGGLDLTLFQAGNGIIACGGDDDSLSPLIDPGDEDADGAIFDLTGSYGGRTFDDRHFLYRSFDNAPWLIALLTDGISDDLLPLSEKGPILNKELRLLKDSEGVEQQLLELISYKKRGSTDDRTIACAFKREVSS